tara:strand:- start:35 stop:451 length:417 start_codon:yes stop_codon:yes gene_type:complete
MNGDLENIIAVVNEVFAVDIRSRNRTRPYMNAKKIYFHIASKIGFSQHQIGEHVGVDHSLVCHHTKSFEYILMSDPLLRRNLEACWTKVNSILGFKNFDHKDKVMLNWKHLTNEQRKHLAELSVEYYNANKVTTEVYV